MAVMQWDFNTLEGCMYVFMHVNAFVRVCIRVCMYVCVYLLTYVCMYVKVFHLSVFTRHRILNYINTFLRAVKGSQKTAMKP